LVHPAGERRDGRLGKFYDVLVEDLTEFAKAEFVMRTPEGEGELRLTHRQTLESLAEQDDEEAIAELEAVPDLMPELHYLWDYYDEIAQTRPSNGLGPCRIPQAEIAAWQLGRGFVLTPFEWRAITAIDTCWLANALKAKG
jgi:hypothetical protein